MGKMASLSRSRLWACGLLLLAASVFSWEVCRAGPRNSVGSMVFGMLVGGMLGVLTKNHRRMIATSIVGALVANVVVSASYHTDSSFLAPIWSLPGALAGACAVLLSSHGMKWAIGGSILGGELPVLACVVFAPMLGGKEIHIRLVSSDIQLLTVFLVVSLFAALVACVVDIVLGGDTRMTTGPKKE